MRCLHGETGRFCRQCVDELEQKCGCDPPAPSPEEDCGHPVQMRYESGYGTVVCMYCGIESPGGSLCVDASYMYPRGYEITVSRKQPYTRAKRFRKYLMRACMSQGLSSVPDSTWKYLQDHGPYSGPRDILLRLKRSKLNNKCYDSLPIMTKYMCPHMRVPTMLHSEARLAEEVFAEIETRFPKNAKFVSYLYLLEHVLIRIGRKDMLPFLNRIQCPKRRRQYEERIRSHHAHAERCGW